MASPGSERSLLTQLVLILASLLCGTGVWVVVQLTETEEVTLYVSVVPQNVEPEVMLRLSPKDIPVKFSYPATEQNRMQPENFRLEVDFSKLVERIGKRLEDSGDMTLSKNMLEDDIDAQAINVQVVDLISPQVHWEATLRTAPAVVVPLITGEPATGYIYNPEEAVIDGENNITVLLTPELQESMGQEGRDTVQISTEPLDVTGMSGIVREQVSLRLPTGVSLLPGDREDNWTVVVKIVEQTITRTMKDVPITYEFIFSGEGLLAEINPPVVDVVVTGKMSAVNALQPEMITFGLFGVAERAGEQREVAVETRITNAALRNQIQEIEPQPRTVTVSIIKLEQPGETPEATPTPVAEAPPEAEVPEYLILLQGGEPEEGQAFQALLKTLPAAAEVTSTDNGEMPRFQVRSDLPLSVLYDQIVVGSAGLPFLIELGEQTETTLLLEVRDRPQPPATKSDDSPTS